eukprot:scaffold137493_cov18-Tisochrysis_lutea.AAC.1
MRIESKIHKMKLMFRLFQTFYQALMTDVLVHFWGTASLFMLCTKLCVHACMHSGAIMDVKLSVG